MSYSVYCGWCGKHLSGPKTDDMNKVSHGICDPCRAAQDAEIEKMKGERRGKL